MQEDISTLPPGTRDITFATPKSVSVLMALLPADDERSSELFDSHDIAVEDIVAWLGKEAAFARSGPALLHPLDWTAVDHAMVAAPAIYLARLRRELVNRLGVTWSRDHRESEWEIEGIPDRLLAEWSDTTCVLPGLPQTVAVGRSAR
ncbi:MAG: relaxase domain-containing protein [Umezawaea sp.]